MNDDVTSEALFQQLAERWQSIPPQVRAALAASLLQALSNKGARCLKDAEHFRSIGLERRASICDQMANAAEIGTKFLGLLTLLADNEIALAKGPDVVV